MREILTWSCAFGAVLFGCQQSADDKGSANSSAPERPAAIVSLIPQDVTTNVGEAPIGFKLYNGGVVLDETVQQIVDRIELKAIPSGNPVSFTIGVDNRTGVPTPEGYEKDQSVPDSAVPSYTAMISVIPAVPLKSGWYSLSLSSVPKGVVGGDIWTKEGNFRSRFSVDSAPVLRQVEVCYHSSGSTRLAVEFSEPMQMAGGGSPDPGVWVTDSNASPCPNYPTGKLPNRSIYADCPAGNPTLSYQIEFAPSLVGTTGRSVVALDESTGTLVVSPSPPKIGVDVSQLPEGTGCRRWTPGHS